MSELILFKVLRETIMELERGSEVLIFGRKIFFLKNLR